MLSITTPGVPATGERAARIARESNEYAAKLAADHGRRFGFFTCVPMDDMDAALKEVAYGFDVLKAQGVGLFTSYSGHWLGDAQFDPLFAELERRKAIVYVHPTSAACCTRLIPEVADTLIEYGTDTTRAIASYVYRGAARRFPNVRMIWSHSGGTMPYLIERFDGADRSPAAKGAGAGWLPGQHRPFLVRHRPVLESGGDPGAALGGADGAHRVRHRLSLPHVARPRDRAWKAARCSTAQELAAIYRGNVAKRLPELV